MPVVADIDLRSVFTGMDAMKRNAKDLRPVFRELRPLVRDDLADHFAHREAPEGEWAPWSPAYLNRVLSAPGVSLKGRRGRGLLPGRLTKRGARRLANMLGRVKKTWSYTISKLEMMARNVVPWAGIHQFGGVAGHGAHIPARPFAWASPRIVGVFVQRARAHVLAGWRR